MEGAIVGALLSSTLPTVISVIRDNLKLEPDVRSIQSELELIQATIGGPRWSGKKASPWRRTWIAQLTRLAADIEYSVDKFLVKATSAAKFATEIRDLKKRIQESSEKIQQHSDQDQDQEPSSNGGEAPPPTSMMSNSAEEDLLALLLAGVGSQSEVKAKVISAIGFGGQNTDLARRVYEKDEVRLQFSQRAWVSAADKSLDDVLTEILGQFEPGASPSDVKHQLESRLTKERYLIVIADVRTTEVYNEISTFSWANRVDGRIIVTAGIQPTARACMCGNALLPLVPDSSSPGLVLVGEVGGMFYEEACFALCASAVARTEGLLGSDYERVVLEDCLLYFSMFPRGHDVRRNPLIRRWMAEGISVYAKRKVSEYANCFDEEIVAKHLDTLIRHNIIKSVKKSNNGKVKRCQTSGMVFNHICGKAVIDNFFTLLCGPTQTETTIQEYVRRLSLHPYLAAQNGGLSVPDVDRLRTMAVFPTEGAQYGAILRFDQHKLLRVLDLKECADLDAKQFPKICDLLLLKYLSLGNSVDCVPRKISRLKWLETLDMRTTDVVTVYSEVLTLPKLKHLLGKFQLASEDCPAEKRSVLNKGAKKKFMKLKDLLTENSVLETLAGIFIGSGIGLPQLLSHMPRLRKVKIWCYSTTLGSTHLTDLKAGIKVFTSNGTRLPNVDYSLSIDFRGSSQSFLYCLEDPGKITSLKLSGNLTLSPPVNSTRLISVQELCLSWTNLSGAQIQQGLSNLRCKLKFLKLVEDNLVELTIQDKDPFVSLERICLVGVLTLDNIIVQDLSKLVSLHLLCETLGALPGVQIRSLRNLKEIGLHSELDGDIKRGWADAAAVDHQRKPKVVSIEIETH